MSRLTARWRSRARVLGDQWTRWREQWSVERQLEEAIAGDGPILAGPWYSEVGYEVLYWIPFLRWVMAAYRVDPRRVVAMSRGGTGAWYAGIAERYAEIFDHVSAGDLRAQSNGKAVKQRAVSEFDSRLIAAARGALQLPESTQVLHPSLMFGWFSPFWSGHETLGFVEQHLRHAPFVPSHVDIPLTLPDEYAVAKFYGARSLPDTAAVRAQVRLLLDAVAERMPVIHLDTGLGLDEHADYTPGAGSRLISTAGMLEPNTNLAVQTRIVSGARLYLGTCGSLVWQAPLLGVPTIPVYTDASFLHAHLHVARRVYARANAAAFAPMDLSGVIDAGLAMVPAARLTTTGIS